jgi:hypothetical protein
MPQLTAMASLALRKLNMPPRPRSRHVCFAGRTP